MPAHEQVTGTVTGETPAGRTDPTTALALTVDRREPFLYVPAAALLGSILLGLVLAVLGPWLNRRIGRGRLGCCWRATSSRRLLRELKDWRIGLSFDGLPSSPTRICAR